MSFEKNGDIYFAKTAEVFVIKALPSFNIKKLLIKVNVCRNTLNISF